MATKLEIEFGDDPPEGLRFASAAMLGRRVHLAGMDDALALCGVFVGTDYTEHMSGYLCQDCERAST